MKNTLNRAFPASLPEGIQAESWSGSPPWNWRLFGPAIYPVHFLVWNKNVRAIIYAEGKEIVLDSGKMRDTPDDICLEKHKCVDLSILYSTFCLIRHILDQGCFQSIIPAYA